MNHGVSRNIRERQGQLVSRELYRTLQRCKSKIKNKNWSSNTCEIIPTVCKKLGERNQKVIQISHNMKGVRLSPNSSICTKTRMADNIEKGLIRLTLTQLET